MWAVNEFSLKGVDFQKFCMNGAALCALGKDCFLELAPDFVGDILWEHLEILQKGNTTIGFGKSVAFTVVAHHCEECSSQEGLPGATINPLLVPGKNLPPLPGTWQIVISALLFIANTFLLLTFAVGCRNGFIVMYCFHFYAIL